MTIANYASQIEKALTSTPYDVVFSPGTIPIAHLKTHKPIVIWTDATFAGLLDFYFSSNSICNESIKNGHKMEQMALSNCRMAIYSSEWAANTALKNYDVSPEKVKVVPFGANINCERSSQDIRRLALQKSDVICKLLFLGVDWYRKGGDMAVAVAKSLIKRGIRTELHDAGCDPPGSLPHFVHRHGFLSKKTKEGSEKLDALLSESHFLILPSRAECAAIVFCEASSYGLPSLATDVGGITTFVRNGRNGRTFSLDESPEKYCDYIETLMSSRELYAALALSSFLEYSERLNWATAGQQVHKLITKCC
jgi:glycosyltransferase involved in cell wall biosynthesis